MRPNATMPNNPPSASGATALIVNPAAGRGQAGREIRDVVGRLRRYGLKDPILLYTQAPGDASRLAREAIQRGASLVVAVGGDGTLHEAMNGVLGTSATMGLLPFGTGNDFARAVGLYGDLDTACRAVARGETRYFDVGTIEGTATSGPKHFLVLCGTGFDARTARTVNDGVKYLSGPLAYIWGAIMTALDFEPFSLTLTLANGDVHQTPAMFVSMANTATTGGGMRIAPDALPDDGLLDICLVRSVGKLSMLWQLTKIFDGKHINHPAVTMLRTSSVSVVADPAQPLLIDGEVCGVTPAFVTIAPRILPMRVPAA